MPMELAGHAHVKINSTDSMIIGMYINIPVTSKYIYFSTANGFLLRL